MTDVPIVKEWLDIPWHFESENRVYDMGGVAPTLTCCRVDHIPKIYEGDYPDKHNL